MSELLDVARRVAKAAAPGEEVEAYVVRTRETDVEVFGGDVESLTTAGVEGVGVRVVRDHRLGYASAGSLDAQIVAETLQEARDNAQFAQPDAANGLVRPGDLDGVVPVELDVWRDELLAVPTDEKVRLALAVEAATRAADPRVRGVEAAGYGDGATEVAISSSYGVESYVRRTSCSAYAVALADDGSGTQTGYGFAAGRAVDAIDVDRIAADAAERACRLLGAKPVPGRRLPVVLDPLVGRAFLGVLASAFNGEAVLKGRSLFAGREGEKVGAPIVTLVEDPTDARALGATTHDSEGVPTRRTALVTEGVLQGFVHNVYTGRRAGAGSTGSAVRGSYATTPGVGVRALRLEPGARGPDEIVAGLTDALYVQSVSGLHSGTNPISGDFSVGAEGLMIRGGAFAEPVREVTIASTLPRMLLDVVEVGSDLTFLPGAVAGVTLVIGEVTLGGA